MMNNPYIHGTTSDILNALPYTDFRLMGPIDLIETYGIAPMTGEITGGGLSSIKDRCMTCFGRVIPKDLNSYTLEKVKKYTVVSDDNDSMKDLLYYANIASKCGYSCINIIIILMMR